MAHKETCGNVFVVGLAKTHPHIQSKTNNVLSGEAKDEIKTACPSQGKSANHFSQPFTKYIELSTSVIL